jgi:hypothetical protein
MAGSAATQLETASLQRLPRAGIAQALCMQKSLWSWTLLSQAG